MEPAMFSVANLFNGESSSDDDGDKFVERDHTFPGMVLRIREFAFHPANANLLWPGSFAFADWLVSQQELLVGRRVLELGSGTGALAVFLRKSFELDITTSDYDDEEIEHNIMYNASLNGISDLPHIRHTWGGSFSTGSPQWDLIIASDILLYVKQFSNLISTLSLLLHGFKSTSKEFAEAVHLGSSDQDGQNVTPGFKDTSQGGSPGPNSHPTKQVSSILISKKDCDGMQLRSDVLNCKCQDLSEKVTKQYGYAHVNSITPLNRATVCDRSQIFLPKPSFLMSWRRRIPREDEALFFEGCEIAGFSVQEFGSKVYCIYPTILAMVRQKV